MLGKVALVSRCTRAISHPRWCATQGRAQIAKHKVAPKLAVPRRSKLPNLASIGLRSYTTNEITAKGLNLEQEKEPEVVKSKVVGESSLDSSGVQKVQGKRQSFMQRAEEEENEQDSFGLDQFAARIHLGKPSGSAYDVELDEVHKELVRFGETQDAEGISAYLKQVLVDKSAVFDKIESRGRLLWSLLRSYGATLPQDVQRRNVWCATQVAKTWSHGERSGYLWGVFVDAMNKSELVGASETLWASILELIKERPQEFAADEAFLWTARLAGIIDAFEYSKVENIVDHLAASAGPDLAGWALTRCLAKSLMIHRQVISKLPLWDGKPLKNFNLRAGQFAPILADVGCVEEARSYWMKDHMDIYKHGSPIPASEKEARMELEHLRAGLLVFARFPRPEAPFDQILAIILRRFEQVVTTYPHLSPHNHGLLYALTRANYYSLANRLAKLFLSCGSSPSIVASAMTQLCVQLSDSRGHAYWVSKRQNEDSFFFRLNDKFNEWTIKAAVWPVKRLLEFPFPAGYKIPLRTLTLADATMRQRYALTKNSATASTNASNAAETLEEDAQPDDTPIEAASSTHSHLNDDEYLQVVSRANPQPHLRKISEEEYAQWNKWLESLRMNNRINLQDVHSIHKIMLSFTVAGKFQEAEDFILSSYRQRPAASDLPAAFLAITLAEHGMFTECLAFMRKLAQDKQPSDVLVSLGYSRFFHLYETLQRRDAPPALLLELWALSGTADTIATMAPTLVKALIAVHESLADGSEEASSYTKAEAGALRAGNRRTAISVWKLVLTVPYSHHKAGKLLGTVRTFSDWLTATGDHRGATALKKWAQAVKNGQQQISFRKVRSQGASL